MTYTVRAELCRMIRTPPAGRPAVVARLWPVAAGTCHACAEGSDRSVCGRRAADWTPVAPDWATLIDGPQRRLACRKCAAVLADADADAEVPG